jgi:ABC-type phosphate transport system ATPase subunit
LSIISACATPTAPKACAISPFHIPANKVVVLFGPAGGGKSTLLRTLNRLNDLGDVAQVSGQVTC